MSAATTTVTTRRRVLVRFLTVTFVVSWVIALPLTLHGLGLTPMPPGWLHVLVPLGPAAGGIIATRHHAGPGAVRDLVRRLAPSSVGAARHWGLALSPLLVAVPTAALVGTVSDVDWSAMTGHDSYELGSWPVAVVAVSLSFGILEEIGWRGFLLPFWQHDHTATVASWRLWVVWATWHLPMFAYQYTLGPQTLGWLVTLYLGSIWLTYLYNTTNGSLAATATWHVTFNLVSIAGGAASEAIPLTVSLAIIVAAIAVARRYGPTDLAPHTRQTTPPAVQIPITTGEPTRP